MIKPIGFIAFCALLVACGKNGPKKGSQLKGQDAVEYLAGPELKTWKLSAGHDYYEYLQFDTKGGCMYQSGHPVKYEVDADSLVVVEGSESFSYKLLYVSDKLFKMTMSGNSDTLVYKLINKKLEEGKYVGKKIDPRWIKGKHGTTWKFDEGEKIYSFMNDGTIIDAVTLKKIDKWKIKDSVFFFGDTKLEIYRLSPVFFDYNLYGMTIKLNYVGEANPDGSSSRLQNVGEAEPVPLGGNSNVE
ncbi:MAG TPA: hypothetical protein VD905_18725 [Flavobacteriales bacterium]|nr:hypothetical protein [Flavobacteriales bacterium]